MPGSSLELSRPGIRQGSRRSKAQSPGAGAYTLSAYPSRLYPRPRRAVPLGHTQTDVLHNVRRPTTKHAKREGVLLHDALNGEPKHWKGDIRSLETCQASKRCSNGSAASARLFMLVGVGLNRCRRCSSVSATYDAA
eukprot:6213081-Pleurochrysis_carterae.AAC.3